MKNLAIITAGTLLMVAILALPLQAQEVTMDEALIVAKNWVTLIIQSHGNWGNSDTAEVEEIQEFKRVGRLIGYFCPVKPQGYILVSLYKELEPVKAYSTDSNLEPESEEGMADLLKGRMERILDVFQQQGGKMKLAEPPDVNNVRKIDYRLTWRALGVSVEGSIQLMDEAGSSGIVLMNYTGGEPPLLTSRWRQNDPFNLQCPTPSQQGSSCTWGNCAVGCGPLACAQVMRYWAWPPGYDWANMPDGIGYDPNDPNRGYFDRDGNPFAQAEAVVDAVARLCHEVGLMAGARYCDGPSSCETGAPFCNADGPDSLDAFKDHFGYSDAAEDKWREDYDDPVEWFNLIKAELNSNRPIPSVIGTSKGPHGVVCDGWQEWPDGTKQYHINYGWGRNYTWESEDCPEQTSGNTDAWYTLDHLPCSDLDDEVMLINIRPESSLGSWIGFPSEPLYNVPPFPYRYFDQDAQGAIATFAPGHNLQFLPGVKVTEIGLFGMFIQFLGEPSANTRLFSIKGTASGGLVAGIKIYNGEIRLYNNGSLKFH